MPDPLPIAPRLMTVMGKAYQGVKNRLYRNLSPYGYEADQYNPNTKKMETVGPVSRLYNAVIKNKKEQERIDTDKNPQGFDREKIDLYGMYLGKGQKYNTIKDSQYKPSVGSGKGKYYSIPRVEESIGISEVKAKDFSDFNNQVLSLAEKGGVGGNNIVGKKGKNSAILNMQPLGDAKISTGEDEKGYYISYYDKWDINPFSGGSKVNSTLANALGIDKNDDISGANGPEVYGRIYFDKKTGKRIK